MGIEPTGKVASETWKLDSKQSSFSEELLSYYDMARQGAILKSLANVHQPTCAASMYARATRTDQKGNGRNYWSDTAKATKTKKM